MSDDDEKVLDQLERSAAEAEKRPLAWLPGVDTARKIVTVVGGSGELDKPKERMRHIDVPKVKVEEAPPPPVINEGKIEPGAGPPSMNISVESRNPPVQVLPSAADRGDKVRAAMAGEGQPRGGGGVIPGAWHPDKRGESVEGAYDIPDDVRQAYEVAAAYSARGAAGVEAAKQGEAAAAYEHASERIPYEQQAAAQQERLHQARNEAVGRSRQLIDDLSQEIRDEKVDPRRLWNDMSFGERLLHGLKAGLSRVSGHLARDPGNRYLDNFEKAMERDAQEQIRRIDSKKMYRDGIQSSMEGLIKLFGDEQQAMLANKALHLSVLEAELEKSKAGAGSALARAQFDSAIGEIARRRAETLLELSKLQQGKVTSSFSDKYSKPQYVGGSGGGKKPELSTEQAQWIYSQREANGINALEESLVLLGEAAGLDAGTAAMYAQQDPGLISNTIARLGVKDKNKLQMAYAAIYSATFKERGATLTPQEATSMTQRYDIGNLQTTVRILGTRYKMKEAALRNVSPVHRDTYDVQRSLEREQQRTMAPPVPIPNMNPIPTRAAR